MTEEKKRSRKPKSAPAQKQDPKTTEDYDALQAKLKDTAKAYFDTNGEYLKEMTDVLKEGLSTADINSDMEILKEDINRTFRKATGLYEQAMKAYQQATEAFKQTEEWPKLQEIFPGITELEGLFCSYLAADIIDLAPELAEILEKHEKEAGHRLTVSEMLQGTDQDQGQDYDETTPQGEYQTLLEQFLEEAQALRKQRTPSVKTGRVKEIVFPLDKFNSQIRRLSGDVFNQKTFMNMANARDQKKGIQVLLPYVLDFEQLEKQGVTFSKDLNSFDQRVIQAATAIYDQCGPIMSIRQIYYAMGGKGSPAQNQKTKIRDSIYKMQKTILTISNAAEASRYKEYPVFTYRGPVFPAEIITAEINGTVIKDAIRLYREPPTITFAKQRKQIAYVSIKYLQNDIKKSKYYYPVEAYLLERIFRAKAGGQKNILLTTLYQHAGVNDRRRQHEARPLIEEMLLFWRDQGLIRNFSMNEERITFTLPIEKKLTGEAPPPKDKASQGRKTAQTRGKSKVRGA